MLRTLDTRTRNLPFGASLFLGISLLSLWWAVACTSAESEGPGAEGDGLLPDSGTTAGLGGTQATGGSVSGVGRDHPGGSGGGASAPAPAHSGDAGAAFPGVPTPVPGLIEAENVDVGGDSGETCGLPMTWSWTSTGPLTEPNNGAASLKDFTVARHGEHYIVYGTTFENGYKGFSSRFGSFDEWPRATQDIIPGGVAPTLLYFAPKGIWVLADQWGTCPFLYRTSTTPEVPGSWSARTCMMQGSEHPGSGGTGPIDQTLICDDTDCYLFYADDAGGIYRGSMPLAEFPRQFTGIVQIMQEPTSVIFEGVQVYSIKGSSQYLMIIENVGIRTFRAWTADSLDGSWTPLPGASTVSAPFAGENNVTWPDGKWTRDISHGDLVRENPSETMEVDLCQLQMLYQGRDPEASSPSYDERPYRPGLLTLVR